ncbi:MAG: hypothetical protein NTV34_00075 [Proteobacteria bacterium]|nr:hypothetical protein [Pseudomonadota bacterium]
MLRKLYVSTLLLISGYAFGGNDIGTWYTGCNYYPESKAYADGTYIIGADNTFHCIAQSYSDAACTQKVMLWDISGKYINEGASRTIADAYNVALITAKAIITVSDDKSVADLNKDNVCGGGWVKGIAKDASDCKDFNESTYNIQKVEGDKLFSGDGDKDHDSTSPEKRPIKFSDKPWIRK